MTTLSFRNIFIKNNRIKIGDFGISKILIGTQNTVTNIGTPDYWPPEVYNNEKHGLKSDIW